jgi:hypothetical protein
VSPFEHVAQKKVSEARRAAGESEHCGALVLRKLLDHISTGTEPRT